MAIKDNYVEIKKIKMMMVKLTEFFIGNVKKVRQRRKDQVSSYLTTAIRRPERNNIHTHKHPYTFTKGKLVYRNPVICCLPFYTAKEERDPGYYWVIKCFYDTADTWDRTLVVSKLYNGFASELFSIGDYTTTLFIFLLFFSLSFCFFNTYSSWPLLL